MAKLKGKTRRKLPSASFAYPAARKYPIHDRAHARNALARAAQSKTYGTYAHVAAAVNRRYPGMAQGKGATKRKGSTRRKRTSARRTGRRKR